MHVLGIYEELKKYLTEFDEIRCRFGEIDAAVLPLQKVNKYKVMNLRSCRDRWLTSP